MAVNSSGQSGRPRTHHRTFAPDTASIGATRRFVRQCVDGFVRDEERLGDIELATSELVTNAVEHGEEHPVTVEVRTSADSVVVSITSARSTGAMGEPSTWAGPLPAVRTGRGLAIVRSVSDAVSVEVGEATLTVSCEFASRRVANA